MYSARNVLERFFVRSFVQRTISGSLFLGSLYTFHIFFSENMFKGYIALLCSVILFFEWIPLAKKAHFLWITPIYPLIPMAILMLLPHALLWHVILICAVHDTAAYLAGKYLGIYLLAPAISPQKTIEGFLGGWAGVYMLLIFLSSGTLSFLSSIFYSLLYALCATAGDLLESWFKRKAGIKDASALLPGHGGLLDRFDSIFFIAIFIYFR